MTCDKKKYNFLVADRSFDIGQFLPKVQFLPKNFKPFQLRLNSIFGNVQFQNKYHVSTILPETRAKINLRLILAKYLLSDTAF